MTGIGNFQGAASRAKPFADADLFPVSRINFSMTGGRRTVAVLESEDGKLIFEIKGESKQPGPIFIFYFILYTLLSARGLRGKRISQRCPISDASSFFALIFPFFFFLVPIHTLTSLFLKASCVYCRRVRIVRA